MPRLYQTFLLSLSGLLTLPGSSGGSGSIDGPSVISRENVGLCADR